MIRTTDGKEEYHLVRPVAGSKAASIPVGADVIFLLDELDKIVSVTLSVKPAHRAWELGQKMSPMKGNLAQVQGVILQPLKNNIVVIRTEDGKGALVRGTSDHPGEAGNFIQRRCRGALGG